MNEDRKKLLSALAKKLNEIPVNERAAIALRLGISNPDGHILSANNQILLSFQSEIPFTIVAGYKQWQKAGRQVKKGEHGFIIWVPCGTKKMENETINPDEIEIYFILKTVFDISQTEAIKEAIAA